MTFSHAPDGLPRIVVFHPSSLVYVLIDSLIFMSAANSLVHVLLILLNDIIDLCSILDWNLGVLLNAPCRASFAWDP